MLNAMTAASSTSSDTPSVPPMRTSMYFSTWLLYHVLRLMVRYVLSGFELELYSQHEYPYLYWYLYELLYPWLTSCLQRADAFVADHEQAVEAQQKTAGKVIINEHFLLVINCPYCAGFRQEQEESKGRLRQEEQEHPQALRQRDGALPGIRLPLLGIFQG